jgi:hypothetical protein
MGKRTGVIRYNLNEIGRSHTGVPRKIDIDEAMRLLNGPYVQEAVRKGDVGGYVGHQFREKFGLDVPETVIVDGKVVVLEVGVRTIYIKCSPTGDVEHEQEFLDTATGRVAQRLWESKAYGFSSAIYAPEEGGVRKPKGFFGMDLVRAPNYDSNRGYAVMLDSVSPGAFIEQNSFVSESAALLDSVDAMIKEADATAEQMSNAYLEQCRANDELIEQNARLLERLGQVGVSAMLDSAPAVMERGTAMDKGKAMLDSASRFMNTQDLVGYEDGQAEAKEKEEAGAVATVAKTLKSAMSLVHSVVRGN